jgi:hypothetical protein
MHTIERTVAGIPSAGLRQQFKLVSGTISERAKSAHSDDQQEVENDQSDSCDDEEVNLLPRHSMNLSN